MPRHGSPTTTHLPSSRAPGPVDPQLLTIFGPPPLLDAESADEYNELYSRLRSAVLPNDVIEELWVRDVVDLSWEILRLRRLKSEMMRSSAGMGVRRMLKSLGQKLEDEEGFVDRWLARDLKARKSFEAMLKESDFTDSTIEAQTLVARLDQVERVDRLIMQAEARRNAVFREMERHRDAVARRARSALPIEDAEIVEVE